jgi:hypothetical protein
MVRIIPLSVLETWPTPNYTNPETRGSTLVIVNAVFIALTIFVVFARLYTRCFINRWFGVDDIFIVLALVSLQFLRSLNTILITYLQRFSPVA